MLHYIKHCEESHAASNITTLFIFIYPSLPSLTFSPIKKIISQDEALSLKLNEFRMK